jgi:hypothetical protein
MSKVDTRSAAGNTRANTTLSGLPGGRRDITTGAEQLVPGSLAPLRENQELEQMPFGHCSTAALAVNDERVIHARDLQVFWNHHQDVLYYETIYNMKITAGKTDYLVMVSFLPGHMGKAVDILPEVNNPAFWQSIHDLNW